MWFNLALAHRGRNRPYPALRLSAIRVAAAVPTFGELSLDGLAASVAVPRFFHRLQRRQRFLQNRSGAAEFFVVNHPQLRPALDRRELSGSADQVAIPGDALDAERGQHVFQVANHQRILSAVQPLHILSKLFAASEGIFVELEPFAKPQGSFHMVAVAIPSGRVHKHGQAFAV
jgi:hypothetical protein